MGRLTDGGWDMCLSGPYQPKSQCLVYSFGLSSHFYQSHRLLSNKIIGLIRLIVNEVVRLISVRLRADEFLCRNSGYKHNICKHSGLSLLL